MSTPIQNWDSKLAHTVRSLLKMSQTHGAGEFLGAEGELLQKMGVSQPTLRQAAKILQNDGMLVVRRGRKGGYYAARPGSKDVLRTVAHYLHLQGATLGDVYAVTNSIFESNSTAAACCTDPALRDQLAHLRENIDEQRSPADFIRSEVELMRLLGKMCGNPAAQLFIEISYEFGLESRQTSLYKFEADRQQARALQRGLCDAVLAGDAEVARLISQRRSAMMRDWLRREQHISF